MGFRSFNRSVKILTAPCGSCEGGSLPQTRPFAVLPTERSSVSENLMEYRFPRSIQYWPTGKAAFGWEDRRLLSTGIPASQRAIRSKGSNPTQDGPGSEAWRLVPMVPSGPARSEADPGEGLDD